MEQGYFCPVFIQPELTRKIKGPIMHKKGAKIQWKVKNRVVLEYVG